jgi:hypothetical protein
MSTQLDPRVLELCGKIAKEQNQATLLRLITELNNVLQRQTGPQSKRDTNRIAAG